MQVNNSIYESMGHLWWNGSAGFEITSLRYCVNPARFRYFREQLAILNARRGKLLDVGCGGGFLSESFAHDGYDVTGIDPARSSIAAAREHAAGDRLSIEYREGRGEALPFGDGVFDIVACCDVLEHVDDPAQAIREAARVLKPGGVFLFDTVNRTARSWIALIKIWQDWNLTGSGVPNAHVWSKFIKPAELARMLRGAGLEPSPLRGLAPVKPLPQVLRTMWKIRSGEIRGEALADEFRMTDSADLSVSYMGYATKPPKP